MSGMILPRLMQSLSTREADQRRELADPSEMKLVLKDAVAAQCGGTRNGKFSLRPRIQATGVG